ncbi:transporter substrate-binding domain-containing protein [Simiduia curdlanivorans]|uniref:Substrate-binding periplasmic protein n=1 Tax=Simiduia curdlanivorans TaxID=1492769 RepID=A0ABV8V0E4_9GAMM|nr:transporter substrate-binding domain-containing protein [Simiduia curdlanivorans]MDN3640321.1 transporter substrate-binding domain-containing protein [Simiduia curdlanivorans]
MVDSKDTSINRYYRALFTLVALVSCVAARAELSGEPKPLPAIVVPIVAPWGFYDADDRQSGLLVNFQNELFKRAKLAVNAELRPYPRVVHDLASGSADMGVMFVSPLAEQSGVSLGHVVTMRVILIAPANRNNPIAKLEDLDGERVGFIRGSKYGRRFDEYPGFEHIAINNVEQGLRMLVTDRLDALVATEQALLYAMFITGIPASQFAAHLTLGNARADLYLSRHSEGQAWVASVRDALKSMNLDGSSTAIFYQHDLWPRQAYCFAGGRCLEAVQPPMNDF